MNIEQSKPPRTSAELVRQFPRAALAHTPTPVEPLTNLSRYLGVTVYVKRDDCTGLAMGGNKARQLEFHIGRAQHEGADVILITGAVQSNYVRMAAAAARKYGMDCHVQLEKRVPNTDDDYRRSGNVLLDHVLGATVHEYPEGEDEQGADRNLERIAASLRARNRRPYIVYLGADHSPIGALGYVAAAGEVLNQRDELGIPLSRIIVPSGSAHTHAGLLLGLRIDGDRTPVTGICVRRDAHRQSPRVFDCTTRLEALLGLSGTIRDADVDVRDHVLAPGYGQLNAAVVDAIRVAGELEGLLLDPVYSGKTMAGLIEAVRGGYIGSDESVLFLHTGGLPALFGYRSTVRGWQNPG